MIPIDKFIKANGQRFFITDQEYMSNQEISEAYNDDSIDCGEDSRTLKDRTTTKDCLL